MSEKLYVVTLHTEAMVWAESAEDARQFADEIRDTEEVGLGVKVEARKAKQGERPSGWVSSSLVYGDTPDLTLAKAEQLQRDALITLDELKVEATNDG